MGCGESSPEPSVVAPEDAVEEEDASAHVARDTTPGATDAEHPGGPEAPPDPTDETEEPPDPTDVTEGSPDPNDETDEPAEGADGQPRDGEALDRAVDDPTRITTISDDLRALMEQTTWEPGCPVEIDELRKLTLRFVDFEDAEHEGELIVHEDVAEDLLGVFVQLYEDRFPIARIDPIEHFDGDDDASMAANNTSAFNCRPITGSDSWSEHSYGWAVDINPIQNPYERDGEVLPPEGEPYLDRADVRAGMVTRPGVVEYFDALGWGWGGDWNTLKDYMHFSLTGR